jgi:hypothetical protein
MSGRVSRRTLLAGLAAVPAPALVGCDDDWSGAGPISTPVTVDFANRLRIPASAESTVDDEGVRIFRLGATTGSAEFSPACRRRPGAAPTADTTLAIPAPLCGQLVASECGHRGEPAVRHRYGALARNAPSAVHLVDLDAVLPMESVIS